MSEVGIGQDKVVIELDKELKERYSEACKRHLSDMSKIGRVLIEQFTNGETKCQTVSKKAIKVLRRARKGQ